MYQESRSGPTTATTHITTAKPRLPNRRAIRHVMRKMNPHGIMPIHIIVRKYGSQVITKCHHRALSPIATMPRRATHLTPAPTKAPARRLGVARVRTATTARMVRYRSEEHTSELQSLRHLVCRLLLEKKHI